MRCRLDTSLPWRGRDCGSLAGHSLSRCSFITSVEKPLSGLESPSREKLSPVTFDSSNKCDRRISLARIQSRGGGHFTPRSHLQGQHPVLQAGRLPSSFQEVAVSLPHSAVPCAESADRTPRPWNATLLVPVRRIQIITRSCSCRAPAI